RAGYGQDPRPDNTAGHTPTNGTQALHRTDADNGAGDGVRRADGHSAEYGQGQGRRRSCFGAEAVNGPQMNDALSHRLDDAPGAEQSAEGDGGMAGQHHFGWHVSGHLESSSTLAG